jgi:hypothetical protein
VRPGHAVPPPADPALTILALLDSLEVHRRPPVASTHLSGTAGETVPAPVQVGLLRWRRGDLLFAVVVGGCMLLVLGCPELSSDLEFQIRQENELALSRLPISSQIYSLSATILVVFLIGISMRNDNSCHTQYPARDRESLRVRLGRWGLAARGVSSQFRCMQII